MSSARLLGPPARGFPSLVRVAFAFEMQPDFKARRFALHPDFIVHRRLAAVVLQRAEAGAPVEAIEPRAEFAFNSGMDERKKVGDTQ